MLYSLRLRLLLTMLAVVAVAAGTVAALASQISASEFQRYVQLESERSQRLATIFAEATSLQSLSPAEQQAAIAAMAGRLGERVLLIDPGGRVIADSAGRAVGEAEAQADVGDAIVIRLGLPNQGDPVVMVAPVGASGSFSVALPTAVSGQPVPIGALPQPTAEPPYAADAALPAATPVPADTLVDGASGTAFIYAVDPGQGGGAPTVSVGALPVSISWAGLAQADPFQAGFISGVNRSLGFALLSAGLAALLLTALLSRQILGPLAELTAAARRLETGDLGGRVAVRSRDEIAAVGRAFNAMADSLQRLEGLRRNMVSDVAHELRTPLTNIRGYLEALRDGVARPEPAMIDSLHEEALLLSRLVDDLQDLALAEAGQLRLRRRPTELGPLVAAALTAARPRLEAHGIRWTTELPAALPPLDIDAERVGQVLRNLLNNAITHTPPGGQIQVAAALAGPGWVEVRVIDSGQGIAPEHLPNIFERFYRADGSRSRASGGAGLGLTIVRQLVHAHGGQVGATSAPGAGAAFRFTLPVAMML